MDVPTAEVTPVAQMGWKMPWGIEPSHLASLSVGDIIVIILLFVILNLITLWLIDKLRCRDKFMEGYECGYTAGLRSKAKQRYHADLDVVVAIVSEDEYIKELDDVTATSYFKR
jgi:hypothetical protein